MSFAFALVGCGRIPLETPAPPAEPPRELSAPGLALEPSNFHGLFILGITQKVDAIAGVLPERLELPEAFDETSSEGAPPSKGGSVGNPSAEDSEADDSTWRSVGEGVRLRARVDRGPLEVRIEDGKLIVEGDLEYAALARVELPKRRARSRKKQPEFELRSCGCAGERWCGEDESPALTAKVRFTAEPAVLSNYRLEAEVAHELLDLDECELGRDPRGRTIAATETLAAMLEPALEATVEALGRSISESRTLERSIQSAWKTLSARAPIDRPGEALHLRPSAVHLGAPFVRDEAFLVPVDFELRPAVLGEEDEGEPVPLPEAKRSSPDATGFRVAIVHEIPVSRASARLEEALVGRRFSRRDQRQFEIERASIYGTEGGAAVRLDVTGSAAGALFLVGGLALDPRDRALHLVNLRFDPPSRRALDTLYDVVQEPNLEMRRLYWVDPHSIVRAVRAAARFPLGEELEARRQGLEEAIERPITPRTKAQAKLDQGTVVSAKVDGEAFRMLVLYEGEIENALRRAAGDEGPALAE